MNDRRTRIVSVVCAWAALSALLTLLAPIPSAAQGTPACGEIANAFGPFDYRTERGNNLHLVESAHFTPMVESLVRGNTATAPGGDLDYTLRAYPNHHRALLSVARLGERERKGQPNGMRYTVDCWFNRAIRFRPDDLTARMIYAGYLYRNARSEDAARQLAVVAKNAGDNPFTHYNAGLVYFEGKNYEQALLEAHRAIELGFPREELREKLKGAGKWSEPVSGATSSAPTAPAASAASAASPDAPQKQ